jgi:acyl carrier protein
MHEVIEMKELQSNEVMERVIKVVKMHARFNKDNINSNSRLRADHGIDSITLVSLMLDMEEEFGIKVDSSPMGLRSLQYIKYYRLFYRGLTK